MHRKKNTKKRHVTLIEVMIVMFLIALIAGVVAYNYRGSLDEGRAFETKQNVEKIKNILELEMSKQKVLKPDELLTGDKWKEFIKNSPLIKNADSVLNDGWGSPLQAKVNKSGNGLHIYSDNDFCIKNPDKCPGPQE